MKKLLSLILMAASAALAQDPTVVTRTGTQTLTNKTISGASNTITLSGASGAAVSLSTSVTTPLILGGTGTTSPLTLQTTRNGSPTTGADFILNAGLTERMRVTNAGSINFVSTAGQEFQVRSDSLILKSIGAASGLLGRNSSASATWQLYNADGNGTYFDYDTVFHLRTGFGGSDVITITGGVVGITGGLTITSTSKALTLPRMTKAQRDAISSPVAGMAVYQTDNTPGLRVYNATNWMKFTEATD